MDDLWERSIPFFKAEFSEIQALFDALDNDLTVLKATPILVGCRNSNYRVDTNKGRYLLRICPRNDTSFSKEKVLYKVLDPRVSRPQLIFVSEKNSTGRPCLIYEFINANSLRTAISNGLWINENIIDQVASNLARIHNSKAYSEIGFVNAELKVAEKLPPFSTWYEMFMGDHAIRRLGRDIIDKIRRLVADHDQELKQIDTNYCLVHGDYRPANLLIDTENQITIVDWEFAGAGHLLADVGQFFRYTSCFNANLISKFAETYNKESRNKLPDNWVRLTKLRDMVNLLQMINGPNDHPQKYIDLRNMILETLDFFGY